MGERSKILIIGGTGSIGKFVLEASAKSGHPKFALFRESTVSDPVKGKIVEGFKNSGVTILIGDLNDHESLLKALKQVDVVISTVGHSQLADQVKIIAAIKEAGNVKIPLLLNNDGFSSVTDLVLTAVHHRLIKQAPHDITSSQLNCRSTRSAS